MYEGKYSRDAALVARRRARRARRKALLASLALLGVLTVGGTLAWMTAQTGAVTNTFTPGTMAPSVDETFDGKTKSNVSVANGGNVRAYVRAEVVVVWEKEGSSEETPILSPADSGDYTISYAADGWIQGDDGFWYYTAAVDPGKNTGVLVSSCSPKVEKEGWRLRVDILATSIQALPEAAAEEAWGVSVENGVLTPPTTINDAA